jgi:hypothetical protein
MSELSGDTAVDLSPEGNDGAYTGVTLGQPGIGDGRQAPLFDGANDFNNIYSAALNTDFDPAEGALMVWAKVSGAGVWTDGGTRTIVGLRADVDNRIVFEKTGTNNNLFMRYNAGGVVEVESVTISTLEWFCLIITWSVADDEVQYFLNGAKQGETDTVLGTWAGGLATNETMFGSLNTAPFWIWDGNLAHGALWAGAGVPAIIQASAAKLARV